jgi:hypothetical protein
MEKSKYGSWVNIAYRAPGSDVAGNTGTTDSFEYNGSSINDTGTEGFISVTWAATNHAKLGDCTANSGNWGAAFTSTASDNPVATIPTAAPCSGLTPNFSALR